MTRDCDGKITTVEVAAPQINGKGRAFGMAAMPKIGMGNLAAVPRRALSLIRELAVLIESGHVDLDPVVDADVTHLDSPVDVAGATSTVADIAADPVQ